MSILRRHWYDLGAVVAICAGIVLFFLWPDIPTIERVLLLNFITMLVHQYEEYGWPGGFPPLVNLVVWPRNKPDRYPLNQNGAMVINLIWSYVFYLAPVFFPAAIWLALGPMLVGFLQVIAHGILTNVKLKAPYNPGMITALLDPLGVYYIYLVQTQGLATASDWVLGTAYMAGFLYFGVLKLNFTWLSAPDSPYPFAPEEMRRFGFPERAKRLAPR
jgi:hypothetical protein